MKSLLFSVFLCCLLLGTSWQTASGQRIDWIRSTVRPARTPVMRDRATNDPGGNNYVAGIINDSIITPLGPVHTWPNPRPAAPRIGGTYLIKYSAQGQPQWLLQLKGVYMWEVDADAAGNVYLLGRNDSSAAFDATTILPLPGMFLAKFNTNGVLQWAERISMPADPLDQIYTSESSFQVDAVGNAYLQTTWIDPPVHATTGFVNQIPVVMPSLSTTDSWLSAVIAKFNPQGVTQWASTISRSPVNPPSGDDGTFFSHISIDQEENVYLTGNSYDTLALYSATGRHLLLNPLGPFPIGNGKGFIIKLRTDGTFINSITSHSGDLSPPKFNRAVLDNQGSLYISTIHDFSTPALCRILKYTAAGDSLWSRPILDLDASTRIQFAKGLAITPQNRLVVTGYNPRTDANTIVLTDTALTTLSVISTAPFGPQGIYNDDRIGTDTLGNVFVTLLNNNTSAIRFPYGPGFVNGWGSTRVKLNAQFAQISGTVYLDANANGQRDAGEVPFARQVAVREGLQNLAVVSSPQTGEFVVYADTGRYDLRIASAPTYYVVTQGVNGYAGVLNSYGQTDTARVFGLAPVAGNVVDVRVSLTPRSVARRGFANRYRARVENIGTATITSGQLTVAFDALMNYVGAVPAPATQTGPSATWNFQNLAPFASRDFDVAGSIPLNVPLNTVLTSQATVTVAGDVDLINNAETLTQTVVGSYDPNDLTVSYTTLTSAQLTAQTPLDYTIRFQNMGTDTAFTVVITDTLPAHLLRLGTLELISSSHNCWWDIFGNDQLVVRFERINLPDHNVSTLGSMGFVRFRVVPNTTLQPGALIPNTAHITFDYNAPLATNQVSTLVQNLTGLPHAPGATALSLYPNPATERTLLTADLPTAGTVQVRLTDALGREVRRTSVTAPAGTWQHPVSTNGLTPGVYGVQLTLPDGATVSRRLVVQ